MFKGDRLFGKKEDLLRKDARTPAPGQAPAGQRPLPAEAPRDAAAPPAADPLTTH